MADLNTSPVRPSTDNQNSYYRKCFGMQRRNAITSYLFRAPGADDDMSGPRSTPPDSQGRPSQGESDFITPVIDGGA